MRAIAAVSLGWGIGKGNDLLFHIPEDLKFFRTTTAGGTVIMGRKTLESMPGGKPLPKRRNIVITRNQDFIREDVEVVHSVEEALSLVEKEDQNTVWVIGGGEIYKAMLPYCTACLITKVHADPDCEVTFPNLDKSGEWTVTERSPLAYDGDLSYEFLTYTRK